MNNISISQLKTRPAQAIRDAREFPVAVSKRNQVKAYLIGKDLYEKLNAYIENMLDRRAVEKTDFSKGKDFEKMAKELGI